MQFNLFQSRLLTEFVCFASGTSILTPSGHQRIETLRPGDLVETLDRGPRPILWHGTRHLDFATADATQKPIEIKQGALGPAMPERRLVVSPQHRVLLHTPNGQALAIAKGLLQAPGVRRRQVTYHSLLLERHEILIAEGLAVESLYPGPYAMRLLTPLQRLQILAMFPGLLNDPQHAYGPPARDLLTCRAAEQLVRSARLRQPPVHSHEECARVA